MTGEQGSGRPHWALVNDVFHRALAEPPDRRPSFLERACAGNPALRAEVASLLSAHERAGDFIANPTDPTRELLSDPDLAATAHVGGEIGHYRITGVLGEGGMGVVYLAEDTRLGRTVALKALAPRFTGDEARRERLRREARAAAALSHPGIATVYALEQIDDHLYIASEYVPGETLRDELARGPLNLATAIDTGIAIGRALIAAHDLGIVHRDLKPENVLRTPAGIVKVLDFGLARFRDATGVQNLTGDGTVLGTPAYMSPEQIRGEAVDGRSDLFALGVMLYELVSGVHPFSGSDATSTVARILEAEPARLELPGSAPGGLAGALDRVIRTCLRKSAGARFRSARDLVDALAHLAATPDGRTPAYVPADSTERAAQSLWWWQFHQGAAAAAYAALLVPLWIVRDWTGGLSGLTLFVVGLVAVMIAAILRLHQWFAQRAYPEEAATQRARLRHWIVAADALLAADLVASASAIASTHGSTSALLVAAAVGVVMSSLVIEPATTRAAFRE